MEKITSENVTQIMTDVIAAAVKPLYAQLAELRGTALEEAEIDLTATINYLKEKGLLK